MEGCREEAALAMSIAMDCCSAEDHGPTSQF